MTFYRDRPCVRRKARLELEIHRQHPDLDLLSEFLVEDILDPTLSYEA